MAMKRYRCPTCLTILWSARAMCAGETPIYDPQKPPGSRHPAHDPMLGVPDGDDLDKRAHRAAFDVEGMPWIVKARGPGFGPEWFGPFASPEEARRFVDGHGLFAYDHTEVFPPGDAVRSRL
jgi:hypothetical protein